MNMTVVFNMLLLKTMANHHNSRHYVRIIPCKYFGAVI